MDDAVCNVAREDEIVRDDQGGAMCGLTPQDPGQLVLAGRVDTSGRLVEDEDVRLGDEHARQGEPFSLAAREVAWMASLEARQPDAGERLARAGEIAADGERHLALGALCDQVATRVLGQVTDPSVTLDLSSLGLEEPGDDLRERRLADAVAAGQCHDLATPEVERGTVESARGAVRVADVVDPDEALSLAPTFAGVRGRPGQVRGIEPSQRPVAGRVEREPSVLDEEDAVAALQWQRGPLLGNDDRRAKLARQVENRLGSLGVELGGRLVQEQQRGPDRKDGRETGALQLAGREGLGAALGEPRYACICERAVDAGPDLCRRRTEVLEPERDLVLDAAEDDLVLGVLKERCDLVGEIGRAEAAGVASGDLDPALEAAAVEVWDEPGQRAQKRRLAGARGAEECHDLTGLDLERDIGQRGPIRTWIRERQPFDLR